MVTNADGAAGGRTALLLGPSGLVGSHCLRLLLEEPRYARVVSPVRRPLPLQHPKLAQLVVDFERLAEHDSLFAVEDVFCCLGTTIRKAGSRAAFRRVDLEYPREAARLAQQRGARRFLLVSAVRADSASRIFYNRVKGEVESAVRELAFERIGIVRPSLLLGAREEPRVVERLAMLLARPLAPLLRGRLARYRPVEARAVAGALLRLALDERGGRVRVVESERIPALAAGASR